ncbi:MAG: STAS domain-containing protein [Sedimentisphaerales bacterium]|jgi:anti-anti-sigma factor
MAIQDLAENVILVYAPAEPGLNEELINVTEIVRERGEGDVVIDFSHVDIVTSSSLSKLLKLRKVLLDCGHRLMLCNVSPATKGIFSITALDGVFEIVNDLSKAMEVLGHQPVNQPL